ncbi:MAG: CPBP family intramembrane glutamic endopeptidase, partial [Filifactoraceae bacterium]
FKLENKKLDSVGLSFKNIKLKVAYGIAIFLFLSLFTLIPLLITNDYTILDLSAKSLNEVLKYTAYHIFFIGFSEELIFRGYFLERFRSIFKSDILGILLSSILFGLAHYNKGISNIIAASFIGIIFSISKLKFKDCDVIALSIAHGLNNSFIMILGYIMTSFFI